MISWGLVVHGSARAAEARREGRTSSVALHIAIAALGAALFTTAIVLGLIVMTSKG